MATIQPLSLPPYWPISSQVFLVSDIQQDHTTESRRDFRKLLQHQLQVAGISPSTDLLDLSQLPKAQGHFISLSHCATAGVFGWSERRLGLDIEVLTKIKSHLVERVSTTQEISEAPHLSYIWCAKEAVFKSHSETIKVVSSVEIFDWTLQATNIWNFKARLTKDTKTLLGAGEIRLIGAHVLCFFLTDH